MLTSQGTEKAAHTQKDPRRSFHVCGETFLYIMVNNEPLPNFSYFSLWETKCHNTSCSVSGKQDSTPDFTTMVNQVSCLAENVISLQNDLADVIFETEVTSLLEFMRETIDFLSAIYF